MKQKPLKEVEAEYIVILKHYLAEKIFVTKICPFSEK